MYETEYEAGIKGIREMDKMSVAKQVDVSTHKSIVKSTKHFSEEGQNNHHQKREIN